MICFRCNNSSFRFVRPPLYIQLRNDLKNKHSIILILRSSLKINVFLLFSLCLFCYFLEISANVLFVSFSFCLNFGQHTSFCFCLFFFHCKFLSFSSLFFSYHRGTVTATLPTLDDQLFTVLFICICVNTNRGENKYVSIWSGHDLISLCNLNQVLLTNVHVFRDKN